MQNLSSFRQYSEFVNVSYLNGFSGYPYNCRLCTKLHFPLIKITCDLLYWQISGYFEE